MAIDFTDYNRITDILMYFSETVTLNFTVSLSSKTKTGERRFFQYETEYNSGNQFNDKLRSIKRNMNFYFTIDDREVFTAGMLLRPQDVELILMLIDQQVLPWFFGDKKHLAFQIIDGKLVLREFHDVIYTQSDSKYIKFEPIVYSFEDGTFSQGIQLILASGKVLPMNIDKFMGFVHLLRTTDMYSTACSMLTYVKQPPYGVNEYNVGGLGSGKPREDWAPREVPQVRKNEFLDSK